MIYTELEKIPLSRFIDVFLGDIDKVVVNGNHSREEKENASEKLCNEYLYIIGGKSVVSHINKRNEILKIHMRMCCLEMASRFIIMEEWDKAKDIMGALGYSFKSDEHDRMRSRIESVIASDKYRIAKLQKSLDNSGKIKMNREYFTREKVSVMSHVKMYIDEDVFSAKEYAYMVRNMCDEIDAMIRSIKKK